MVRRKATALDDGVRQFLADHPPSCARVNLKLALDNLGEGAVWESLKWLRAESDAAPREARAAGPKSASAVALSLIHI